MVWDIEGGYATHSLRGHEGNISAIAFKPHPVSVQQLVVAEEGGGVRIWDLITSQCAAIMKEHYSAVKSIIFSPDPQGHIMITAGRDRVLNVWDMRDFHSETNEMITAKECEKLVKATLPMFESIESAATLPLSEVQKHSSPAVDSSGNAIQREFEFVTAGDRGLVRRWKLYVTGMLRKEQQYKFTAMDTYATDINFHKKMLQEQSTNSAVAHTSTAAAAAGGEELPLSKQFERLFLVKRPKPASSMNSEYEASSDLESDSEERLKTKRRRLPETCTDDDVIANTKEMETQILVISKDQVLSLLRPFALKQLPVKTIAGYNDAFTDVKYIPWPLHNNQKPLRNREELHAYQSIHPYHSQRLVTAAVNSELVRVIDTDTFHTRFFTGHEDTVLAVAPSPDGTLIASASKDHTVRLWDMISGECVGVCRGHTESVVAVAFPSRAALFLAAASKKRDSGGAVPGATGWVVSGGKDRTLKLWDLTTLLEALPSPRPKHWSYTVLSEAMKALTNGSEGAVKSSKTKNKNKNKENSDSDLSAQFFSPLEPRASATVVAHERDINAIACSPNDKLLATASQDRTVRLWTTPDLTLAATLRGHKRGVWNVTFSPTQQVLASASGDKTIRLWSTAPGSNYACLRTFEGHDAPVLAVGFLRKGSQLVSTGADGLLKLWAVQDAECINTMDGHADRVWSLAVRPPVMNKSGEGVIGAQAEAERFGDLDSKEATEGQEKGSDGEDDQDERLERLPMCEHELELVTGGSDSVLNVWKDVTSQEAEGEMEAAEEAIEKQQQLFNAMANRDYIGALSLTLELDQPGRCADILAELLEIGPTKPTVGVPPKIIEQRYREEMLEEVVQMEAEVRGLNARVIESNTLRREDKEKEVEKKSKEKSDLDKALEALMSEKMLKQKQRMDDQEPVQAKLTDDYDWNKLFNIKPTESTFEAQDVESSSDSEAEYTELQKRLTRSSKPDGSQFILNVLEKELKKTGGIHPVGVQTLQEVLDALTPRQLTRLLGYVREWNTQSRHGILAQRVLYITLHHIPRNRLLSAIAASRAGTELMTKRVIPGLGTVYLPQSAHALQGEDTNTLTPLGIPVGPKAVADEDDPMGAHLNKFKAAPMPALTAAATELRTFTKAALPYSERHLERIDRLYQSSFLVDYILRSTMGVLPSESFLEDETAEFDAFLANLTSNLEADNAFLTLTADVSKQLERLGAETATGVGGVGYSKRQTVGGPKGKVVTGSSRTIDMLDEDPIEASVSGPESENSDAEETGAASGWLNVFANKRNNKKKATTLVYPPVKTVLFTGKAITARDAAVEPSSDKEDEDDVDEYSTSTSESDVETESGSDSGSEASSVSEESGGSEDEATDGEQEESGAESSGYYSFGAESD